MRDMRQKLVLAGLRRMHRWRRSLTLGARVAVFDENNRILLVRHTYAPGWLFPGGGVEFGESVLAAAIREIHEEAGIVAQSAPQLFGVYLNHQNFPGDHLLFYTLRNFLRKAWKPNSEIAEAKFFPLDDCPPDTTGGTRRRLEEIAGREPPAEHW